MRFLAWVGPSAVPGEVLPQFDMWAALEGWGDLVMDDELIETLVRAFPMVPRPIIVALIADAASWLELTDVQITMAAVRPLVVEALEFRLHGQRALC